MPPLLFMSLLMIIIKYLYVSSKKLQGILSCYCAASCSSKLDHLMTHLLFRKIHITMDSPASEV